MIVTHPTIVLPPRVGVLLSQMADTPDLEAALLKVLTEYIDLKIQVLKHRIASFETKWEMTFVEFSDRCAKDELGQDPYVYEVESDFWAWEEAETLITHYRELQDQWM